MAQLKEGHIYAIDGGFFQAQYDEETQCVSLWTYQGYSGRVIGRTGFDVDPSGQLYHRVFDFETREQVRIPAEGCTMDDLVPVDKAEFDD